MSIASEITRISNNIASAYSAIQSKGGTIPVNRDSANLVTAVNSISGGSSVTTYHVIVIDYDGTVLKEQNLTEGSTFTLPSAPTHERLTFQGWSSPVTINSNTVTVGKSDIVIGAMYTTKSGAIELDVEVNETTGLSVSLGNSYEKDWGDGTTDTSYSHTYAEAGRYTISCINSSATINVNPTRALVEVRLSSETKPIIGLYSLSSLKAISVPQNYWTEVPNLGSNQYLKAIVIPEGVTSIYNSAFSTCFNLKYAVFPSTLKTIKSGAFHDCGLLQNVSFPEGLETIESNSSSPAFKYCQGIKRVYIPGSVTTIGANAFSDCDNLKEFYMNDNSTADIPSYLFSGSGSLKKVHISSKTKNIRSSAFYESVVEEVDFPSHLENIESNAFYECNNLNRILILGNNLVIGASAFFECNSAKSISLSGVSSIGSSAFQGCYAVENLTLPAGLTMIDSSAFRYSFVGTDCLLNVIIPEGVTTIKSYAFDSCRTIQKVVFPSTLEIIYENAFSYCYGVRELDFSSALQIVSLSSSYALYELSPYCVIKVPSALYDEWIADSNWSSYASRIIAV